MKKPLARGVTLVEVLVAVAIAAILLGMAVPSFVESASRTRLEGVVSTLAADIQFTRSESIRHSGKHVDTTKQGARLVVNGTGTGYTIWVRPAEEGAEVAGKAVTLPDGVTLPANTVIAFDSLRGATAAQSVLVESQKTGAKLQINTTVLGRVSVCTPSGTFAGYTSC